MNRLSAITTLRDACAHSAVDTAIEAIRDDLNRWDRAMEPEEREHTRMILDRLLDLQANAVRSATRRGETMSIRLTAQERVEADAAAPVLHPIFANIINTVRPAA